jgi:hypothetical protein
MGVKHRAPDNVLRSRLVFFGQVKGPIRLLFPLHTFFLWHSWKIERHSLAMIPVPFKFLNSAVNNFQAIRQAKVFHYELVDLMRK